MKTVQGKRLQEVVPVLSQVKQEKKKAGNERKDNLLQKCLIFLAN